MHILYNEMIFAPRHKTEGANGHTYVDRLCPSSQANSLIKEGYFRTISNI